MVFSDSSSSDSAVSGRRSTTRWQIPRATATCAFWVFGDVAIGSILTNTRTLWPAPVTSPYAKAAEPALKGSRPHSVVESLRDTPAKEAPSLSIEVFKSLDCMCHLRSILGEEVGVEHVPVFS